MDSGSAGAYSRGAAPGEGDGPSPGGGGWGRNAQMNERTQILRGEAPTQGRAGKGAAEVNLRIGSERAGWYAGGRTEGCPTGCEVSGNGIRFVWYIRGAEERDLWKRPAARERARAGGRRWRRWRGGWRRVRGSGRDSRRDQGGMGGGEFLDAGDVLPEGPVGEASA